VSVPAAEAGDGAEGHDNDVVVTATSFGARRCDNDVVERLADAESGDDGEPGGLAG